MNSADVRERGGEEIETRLFATVFSPDKPEPV